MYEKELAEAIRYELDLLRADGLGELASEFDTDSVPSENGAFAIEFETGERFVVLVQQVKE